MTAAQPQQVDPHSQLASALGTRFAQQLFRVLPDHAKALGPHGLEKTKFTTVVDFLNTPEGLDIVVTFKNSIPLPGVRVKIGWLEEQLSLLPQEEPTPQAVAQAAPAPPAPPTQMQQRTEALAASSQPAPAFAGRRPDQDEDGIS